MSTQNKPMIFKIQTNQIKSVHGRNVRLPKEKKELKALRFKTEFHRLVVKNIKEREDLLRGRF